MGDEELEMAEVDARSHRSNETTGSPGEAGRHNTSATASTSSSSIHEHNPEQYELRSRSTAPDLERLESVQSRILSRIETQRLQHSLTVGESVRSRPSKEASLPPFGAGKPYPPRLPSRDEYVVEFDGPGDPLFPQNWHLWTKIYTTAMLAFTSVCSTFDSAIFTTSTQYVAQQFNVGVIVATLASSLYILGYAFGPLIWAPLSELRGRRLPIIISLLGFSIFNTAIAVAKDLQTILICRFFAGAFGSSPLVVVAAIFSDIYDTRHRGIAIALFSSTVFGGPLLAPFIGGYINMSYLGWRWTAYIPAFMGYTALVLTTFFLKESYAPVILVSKAAELRRRTRNWGIHAKQEEIEVDFRELVVNNFSRPIMLLIKEPVILSVTLYLSFIYGLLYCFLTAYTLVFQGVYGMNPGLGGLNMLGMFVGVCCGGTYVVIASRIYNRKLDANGGVPIPEWRLPPVIVGGALFAGGIFWFGWTGYTGEILWIVPTLSGLLTGLGLLVIFIQLFNYLIDTYLALAASAIAANTICRSAVAAAFPLFSTQMFNGMGIEWASTLLGCIAAVLVPIPVLFYLYGKKLRMRSKYAPMYDVGHEADSPEDETNREASGEANERVESR